MKLKKGFLYTLALTLFVPSITRAASFDSMFGMSCGTLDCWVQGVWSWMAGVLITASSIMLMAAGYIYMTSGGDPSKVAKAHQIIIGVFSGLLLLVASYFFLTQVLGLDGSVWRF